MRQMIAATMLAVLATGPVKAGEVGDFEAALRAAYGDYRTALFVTNSGDAAKAAAALSAFGSDWAKLQERYGAAPPPQYADDPQWQATLNSVRERLDTASADVAAARLPEAHAALEGIRDDIGALHERNGIALFSDRMNAYHAAMEQVIEADPAKLGADYPGMMREWAGVLAYLTGEIERRPAPEAASAPDYAELAKAFRASVDGFVAAARTGEAEAIRKAAGGLKGPYSKFFLKFG